MKYYKKVTNLPLLFSKYFLVIASFIISLAVSLLVDFLSFAHSAALAFLRTFSSLVFLEILLSFSYLLFLLYYFLFFSSIAGSVPLLLRLIGCACCLSSFNCMYLYSFYISSLSAFRSFTFSISPLQPYLSTCHFLLRSCIAILSSASLFTLIAFSVARLQHYPWFSSHTLLIHTLLPLLSPPYPHISSFPFSRFSLHLFCLVSPYAFSLSLSFSLCLFLPPSLNLSLSLSLFFVVPSRLLLFSSFSSVSRQSISFCLPLLVSHWSTETERVAVDGGDEREQIGGGYHRLRKGARSEGWQTAS